MHDKGGNDSISKFLAKNKEKEKDLLSRRTECTSMEKLKFSRFNFIYICSEMGHKGYEDVRNFLNCYFLFNLME